MRQACEPLFWGKTWEGDQQDNRRAPPPIQAAIKCESGGNKLLIGIFSRRKPKIVVKNGSLFETDCGVQCHGPRTRSHRDQPIGPTPQPRTEGVSWTKRPSSPGRFDLSVHRLFTRRTASRMFHSVGPLKQEASPRLIYLQFPDGDVLRHASPPFHPRAFRSPRHPAISSANPRATGLALRPVLNCLSDANASY